MYMKDKDCVSFIRKICFPSIQNSINLTLIETLNTIFILKKKTNPVMAKIKTCYA
jgi:hypothetical protein